MKKFLVLATLLFSANAFCCKPATQMRGETWLVSGILNKLTETVRFNDFQIKSIVNTDSNYLVEILNTRTNVCLELVMSPWGPGNCEFTADIISEKKCSK